jgi:hypothetical protein
MNNELETMCKKTIVAYLRAMSQNFRWGTKETEKTLSHGGRFSTEISNQYLQNMKETCYLYKYTEKKTMTVAFICTDKGGICM